jgi:hypothetical protein
MRLFPAASRSLRLLERCGLWLVLTTSAAQVGAAELAVQAPAKSLAPASSAAPVKASATTTKSTAKSAAKSAGDSSGKSAAQASTKPPARGKKKLLLFAKDPGTWSIVKGGASGKVIYREATGAFALDAAKLNPRSAYALVRFVDAPPRADIIARGTSDERGGLELNGIWRNWTQKFWLVSGEDVAGSVGGAGTLRAWRPERYLFEEKPLGIPCACPEPEEP